MKNIKSIEELRPKAVFKYFMELCEIPHGSGNVQRISNYCVEFAKKNNLWYRQDESFNVIIRKPASKGCEDKQAVILQGHLDMVSVKEPECSKELTEEGLDVDYADGYVYAKQTSLGADDGIAIAYALAILASEDIEHPMIEAIFTVDEEIGMLGASVLDLSDIKAKTMLNMDSEEEGVFTAGCAGGATVKCVFPVKRKAKSGVAAVISIDNLTGGHSGIEIVCQRANANLLLGRVLFNLKKEFDYRIVSVSGGEKDNAIAKWAKADILIDKDEVLAFSNALDEINSVIKAEYTATDSAMTIGFETGEYVEREVLKRDCDENIITALMSFPNGVLKMSNDIKGLVQTSLNLGVMETSENEVSLSYSVRSAVKSEKENLIDRLKCLTAYIGGSCNISGEYPAWEYKRESRLRDVMVDIYKRLYGTDPKVETIHAGVECGIIADKIEGLDCISFGPNIKNIHTTKEKLDVASVERTWKLILEVLKEL